MKNDVARSRALGLAAVSLVAIVAMLVGVEARAQELPWKNQALLLLRAVAYDRSLASRSGDSLVIAVLYDASNEESKKAKAEMKAALENATAKLTIAGLPAVIKTLAYDERQIATDFRQKAVSVTYVCPGLDSQLPRIREAARNEKVLSVTGSRKYVESGLSIAAVLRESKAGLVINLPATRAEGADLPTALLRVAEVVQ